MELDCRVEAEIFIAIFAGCLVGFGYRRLCILIELLDIHSPQGDANIPITFVVVIVHVCSDHVAL